MLTTLVKIVSNVRVDDTTTTTRNRRGIHGVYVNSSIVKVTPQVEYIMGCEWLFLDDVAPAIVSAILN